MGHLGRLKEQYRDLADRLQHGTVALVEPETAEAWEGWREILEILFTPEEAALAARLPFRPSSLQQLAARLGLSEEALRPRLEVLCDRGVVMDLQDPRSGRTLYLLSPPVVGFFEYSLMRAQDGIPKKRMAEALHAYTQGDSAFAREAFGHATKLGRALVHEDALADPSLPDVLDWERATQVVGEARSWAVSLCFCRHEAEHLGRACGAPRENCLSLNGGADYVVRRRFGRPIERAEALDLLTAAREHGLAQVADNVQRHPAFVCNCCGCCCEQLRGANLHGLAAVNPSGFAPAHDPARCAGCGRCARACPVAAIELRPARRTGAARNALVPAVDLDACIGCGVCSSACHKGALRMARRSRPTVPVHAVEKALRMALERNQLAELLFDAGGSLGSRFLHRAVEALTRLPAAQRLLALEQVRSRFVRAALERYRDVS